MNKNYLFIKKLINLAKKFTMKLSITKHCPYVILFAARKAQVLSTSLPPFPCSKRKLNTIYKLKPEKSVSVE